MALTGNIGEWSEIYVLFKVLSDEKLFKGDENLNKIEDAFYPIINVLRQESQGTFKFSYDSDIVIINNNQLNFRIPIQNFKRMAELLLLELRKKPSGAFSIPIIEEFINSYNSHSLKAQSSIKTDINIVIHDSRTGATPLLGFSIKSQLGGASTLLNAGKTTNFIYKVTDTILDKKKACEINSINSRNKIKDRITKIYETGGHLEFTNTENLIFNNNLVLIDSCLPNIIAECLLYYYLGQGSRTKDIINILTQNNTLEYNMDNGHPFYEYKYKRFLTDIALGMMPGTVWNGVFDTTGGFLIVKDNGDVLCYHIYNRNEFENYLFNNTRLETASSTKHQFGLLYKEKDNYFFKLNLQIRFL